MSLTSTCTETDRSLNVHNSSEERKLNRFELLKLMYRSEQMILLKIWNRKNHNINLNTRYS